MKMYQSNQYNHLHLDVWVVYGDPLPPPSGFRWPDPRGAYYYKAYDYDDSISAEDYLRMQGKEWAKEFTP